MRLTRHVLPALVALLTATLAPSSAHARNHDQIFGVFGTHVKWSSCSFDAGTGTLTLTSTATDARWAYAPLMSSALLEQTCPGAGGTALTSITALDVRMSGPTLWIPDYTRMRACCGRVFTVDLHTPADTPTWVSLQFARSYTPAPVAIRADSSGIDADGDGAPEIRVHAAEWNVQIRSDVGGTFDLGGVPADSTDQIIYDFGAPAVRVVGPRTGPDVKVSMPTGSANDVITTYGGDDYIASANGNDVIRTGDGRDAVFGGAGADVVFAGTGDDWVSATADSTRGGGGSGRDRVWLGSGNDFGAVSFRLYGQGGRDIGWASIARGAYTDLGPGSDFLEFFDPTKPGVAKCGDGLDYFLGDPRRPTAATTLTKRRTACERPGGFGRLPDPVTMSWYPMPGLWTGL